MKLRTFILLLFVFAQYLEAQVLVKGNVFDNAGKSPIEFASIRAFGLDSTVLSATSSDEYGRFELKLDSGRYTLETSFLGYDTSQIPIDITNDIQTLNLDTIFLLEKSIELDGLSVIGKPPAMVVKGDTIEYSVGAFQGDEHDALQDIIRKLPGVELDANGNLKANGKAIDRILIDGKEFFGNDIARALRDLPAKMIQKIQLFKKDTGEAEHTGFKSEENEEQVLNLQVKEEAKKSIFGDIGAGYGTEDKYNVSGSIYRMRDENQLMARGTFNNLDQQFGGASFGYTPSGIRENKEFSLTYNAGKKDKFEYETGASYNDNRNINKSETESQYFLSTGDRFSVGKSTSESRSKDLSGNFRLEWKPDTLTSITLSGRLSHSKTSSINNNENLSYVVDTTYTKTDSRADGNTNSANFNLYASRQLGKKDRRIMFMFSGNFRDWDENRSNLSTTRYSLATESPIVLDQKSNAENKATGWSTAVTYVEPIAEGQMLMLGYAANGSESERDRETLRKDEFGQYAIVDTAYTRLSKNSYLTHRIRAGFQTKKEKYNYILALEILPQTMKTEIAFRDSIIDDLKQEVVNFSPNFMFSWNPEKDKSLSFNYNGMTEQPGLTQLSSDTTYLGATNKQYGNPNLKTGFRNSVNVYYNSSNTEKETYLSVFSSFDYTLNSIANYSMMDSLGRTESTYRNVSGNMSANLGANYSWMIKKVRTSVYGGANYSRNKGFVNQQASISDNYGLTSNFSLSYSHEKIDAFLQGSLSSNWASSNLSSSQNLDMTNYAFTNRITWRMPFDFTFSNNLSYSHNSKVSDDIPQSNTIWDLTLSKSVLKGKVGTLKVHVNNLLNEKNNVQRFVSDSQLSYTRDYSIGRYILFSFAYKFNVMGK